MDEEYPLIEDLSVDETISVGLILSVEVNLFLIFSKLGESLLRRSRNEYSLNGD